MRCHVSIHTQWFLSRQLVIEVLSSYLSLCAHKAVIYMEQYVHMDMALWLEGQESSSVLAIVTSQEE